LRNARSVFSATLNALGSSTSYVVDIIIPTAQEGKLHTNLRNGLLPTKLSILGRDDRLAQSPTCTAATASGLLGEPLDMKKTLDSLSFFGAYRLASHLLICGCQAGWISRRNRFTGKLREALGEVNVQQSS